MTDHPEGHGVFTREQTQGLTGLEVLNRMIAGDLPRAPIAGLMGFRLAEVSEGRSLFEGLPDERHYNPIGSVHGGYAATLLDSCMGCAVQTTLGVGEAYATMEFKVSLLRGITRETGLVRAIGTLVQRGRRAAFAEGRLEDASGRLLATGTTTCIVMAG